MLELSEQSRAIAAILVLSFLAVESGGLLMFRIVRGKEEKTELQRTFSRAGHAHAGVWVTLGLVIQVLADATDLTGLMGYIARVGVPFGAILLPAGFFLAVAHRGATSPNRLLILVHLGAVSFAAGVLALGIGLLTA